MRNLTVHILLFVFIFLPSIVKSLDFESPNPRNIKELTASVRASQNISIEDFKRVILDADNYPTSARGPGGVKVLEESALLDYLEGLYVVFQRTGGNGLVTPRQYVFGMWVEAENQNGIVIEWLGIEHSQSSEGYFGPYADKLNEYNGSSVYPPYKHGRWIYDRKNGKITYEIEIDPGGNLAPWSVSDKLLLAGPSELLQVRLGLKKYLKVVN